MNENWRIVVYKRNDSDHPSVESLSLVHHRFSTLCLYNAKIHYTSFAEQVRIISP